MTMSSTALRILAAGALGLPLTLGVGGVVSVADATTPGGSDCGAPTTPTHGSHESGQTQAAHQGGSVVDPLAQVNPALNVGPIASSGGSHQVAWSGSSANSGIQQSGGGHGGDFKAFQAGDVVAALVQVNPAANVGPILSSGGSDQKAVAGSNANSGIQQR